MAQKILIVDDERGIAEIVGERLQDNGYETAFAYDGLSALDTAVREKPDLILLDYTLPKMNGDKVCRRFKADAQLRNTPVILLSAYRRDCLESEPPADAFLSKPFDSEELLELIRSLLSGKA